MVLKQSCESNNLASTNTELLERRNTLIASQHEGLSSVIASMRFISMHMCVCLRQSEFMGKLYVFVCMSGADNSDSLRS